MPPNPIHLPDPLQARQSYRVRQISAFVGLASVVVLPIYCYAQYWAAVIPLACGMSMMLLCQVLDRRGYTESASITLVTSITAMAAGLQWMDQGLRDASVLTFPVVLILAGMLLSTRFFVLLWFIMVLFLVVMTLATETYGWRANRQDYDPFDHLRDATIILLVSAVSVWYLVNDLRKTLRQLAQQIGKYEASEGHLTHIARHDTLTGLPNRAFERERTELALAQARRNGTRLALLFVDIDYFKAINDSLGHAAGDEFLVEVAERLRRAVRETDVVSRHGGDEFVIALTAIDKADDASVAADKILVSLGDPLTIKDTQIVTSCSIGIALFPEDGADYESLLRNADIAMYQAKESGRNVHRYFDDSMNAIIAQNLLLVSGLRLALEHRQFVLHYQPIVDLATGDMLGCEALIRWQHPHKGLISPAEFIASAEKSGLIVEMGAWVLGEACRQLAQWHAAGYGALMVSVNLSAVQFRRGDIDAVVQHALQQSGLQPEFLELEVTESTLIQDNATFMQTFQRLKALGVRISIDDFGTGYSNLSYLPRFAVNKLKIDQSFVRRLHDGADDRAIVVAIIQMAKSLRLTTTAEGIEDDATRKLLAELGCDQGQGYFFARPKPAEVFCPLQAVT